MQYNSLWITLTLSWGLWSNWSGSSCYFQALQSMLSLEMFTDLLNPSKNNLRQKKLREIKKFDTLALLIISMTLNASDASSMMLAPSPSEILRSIINWSTLDQSQAMLNFRLQQNKVNADASLTLVTALFGGNWISHGSVDRCYLSLLLMSRYLLKKGQRST